MQKRISTVFLAMVSVVLGLCMDKLVRGEKDSAPVYQKLGAMTLCLPPGNEDLELTYIPPKPFGQGGDWYELRSKTGKTFTCRDLHGGGIYFNPFGEEMEPGLKVFGSLDGANLRGFETWRVDFIGKLSLRDADLRDTDLVYDSNGSFASAGMGWDVTGADIRGAKLPLSEEELRLTESYYQGDLTGWKSAGLKDVDFRGFDLSKAIFEYPMPGCDFTDAVITGANCRGLTLEQIKQTWNYRYGHMEGVTVSEEVRAALEAEKAAKEETSTTESATTSADTTETSNAAETSDVADTPVDSQDAMPVDSQDAEQPAE